MVTVRDAATVVLVRDRPALQVLLLQRTPHAVFSPGASVFPGGAVDEADRAPATAARMVGPDDVAVSTAMSLAAGGAGVVMAAVRECFEEAGLLLARSRVTGARIHVTDDAHRRDLARLRHELNAGRCTWSDVLDAQDAVVDARDLHPFAHWRTPIGAPRRYDTWFFVTEAPDGDDGVHDDNELVASEWMAPAEVLDRFRGGGIDLIFPTLRTLTVLSAFTRTDEALRALHAVARDDHGRPQVVNDGGGERVALAGDAGAPAVFGWTVPLPDLDPRALAREGVA